MKSFSDFSNEVRKAKESRHYEVHNSYGVRDAYKFYVKHKPSDSKYVLKDVEYYKIIRAMNLKFCDLLRASNTVRLPCKMGMLETFRFPTSIRYEGTKLINNHPIDWNQTLRLWYEDPEAKANKTLVRTLDKELVRLFYNKCNTGFNNKCFFSLEFNRELKKSIRALVLEGKFDTYNSKTYGKSIRKHKTNSR